MNTINYKLIAIDILKNDMLKPSEERVEEIYSEEDFAAFFTKINKEDFDLLKKIALKKNIEENELPNLDYEYFVSLLLNLILKEDEKKVKKKFFKNAEKKNYKNLKNIYLLNK